MGSIEWKAHCKNGLTMVYGFQRKRQHAVAVRERFYDVVLSLYRKGETTTVYGFLSRVPLAPEDFLSLWETLKVTVKTEFLIFEVLPEHAPVYKKFLPVIETVTSKTFNGYHSEIIKVRVR